MRIGVDIRSLLETFPSGVSEYTHQIIKHLLKIDKENEYLLFCNSQRPLPRIYRQDLQGANVVFIERRMPNKFFNASLFFLRYPKLDNLLNKVDLFFIPNFNFIALSPQCKKVVMIHDLSFCYPGFNSLRSKWWHRLVRPKALLKQADIIICPSESTFRDIRAVYGINPNKIKVVPLAVDEQIYQDTAEGTLDAVRNKYKLFKPYLLFMGTVEERKNIVGLLEAWKIFQKHNAGDFDLVIVGAIKNKRLPALFPGVRFLDYIPNQHKPSVYRLATGFVYPSFYEGFGLPVLEAMAAGTPVITSFSTSLPEIAGQAALLINPYNLGEMAMAFRQITSNQELRQRLIDNGRTMVTKFNWTKTAMATLEIFTKVINK